MYKQKLRAEAVLFYFIKQILEHPIQINEMFSVWIVWHTSIQFSIQYLKAGLFSGVDEEDLCVEKYISTFKSPFNKKIDVNEWWFDFERGFSCVLSKT